MAFVEVNTWPLIAPGAAYATHAPGSVKVHTEPFYSVLGQFISIEGGLFIPNVMASGALFSTISPIYTAPATLAAAYVKKLTLFNTGNDLEVVELHIVAGVQIAWQRIRLQPNEAADVIDIGEAVILHAGQSIRGRSTNSDVVDYYIAGVIETPAP